MSSNFIPTGNHSKRRDLFELAFACGLILLIIWTPRPWQEPLWLVAIGFIAAVTCLSFEGLEAMGLRIENLSRSLWIVGVAVALAAGAVFVSGTLHALRLPGGPSQFFENYGVYTVWAFVQQFLLQTIFLSRLLRLVPNTKLAAFLAALIFALAHLPNPILTPVTLVLGLASCLAFLHYRNLYSLALAHAILGISIAVSIPGPVDHNMRVGLSYLTYTHGTNQLARP